MTICVAVKVHDCIVFAADSASSLTMTTPDGHSGVINVWKHGIKVFNLYKGLPIAAMTCGMGNFGTASISNLAKDLRLDLSRDGSPSRIARDDYTIREVADRAKAFFEARYNALEPRPPSPHSFEFWIGGYGSNGAQGEMHKIAIVDGTVLPVAEVNADVAWAGQPAPINRLLLGFDAGLPDALVRCGLPQDQVEPLMEQLRSQMATPLVHPTMPVADAIQLADFLVDVTKRYFAFLPGADIVGGDTDIATVTKHEGFKWIRRKHYYPSDLNLMETDHVR